jgi:hypothetical protein
LRPNIAACKQPRDHLNHQIRQLTVDFAAEERLPAMYPLVEPREQPIAPTLEKRIRKALAAPGRPGVRVIAKQLGVDPGTVQSISRPFAAASVAAG